MTEPVDLLLNLAPITAEDFAALMGRVRDGGVVVSTTPMVPTPNDQERDVRGETIFVQPNRTALSDLVKLVDRGELRIDIARHVTLIDLPELHSQAEAGRVHGKVIVLPPTD
ncbi:zinc-binding dehydrogenase [Litorihabitans aurantiacus]|uniref:Zinc-binding dehydrogenase n=1 Tax=Litorihabitans aurantiacus TaxID=1930061 RepID=A0AA38CV07_9MICO|nr:hypothetical protein GCM10025875_36790 [Litorihabitans aurantiacus]GMA33698.1 hypothetical protein GCM10025875_36900 [Litorihabitans aurantiacus]GMA33761.1 hypothetical protein GCM10025875_37530 [Litorihabitans aurantiacus]